MSTASIHGDGHQCGCFAAVWPVLGFWAIAGFLAWLLV